MRLHGTMENRRGRLWIGGIPATDLAAEYGTPLYVYDEEMIRSQCGAILQAGGEYQGQFSAYYASKAFPNAAVVRIAVQSGMGVDVASEGELAVAMMAGAPMDRIMLHGAYKTDRFLTLAIEKGAGTIVIDSFGEIPRIERIAAEKCKTVTVLLRLNPGVEAETHKAVQTANLDTKFGVPLLGGEALRAVSVIKGCAHMQLRGVHCHVGSQVFKMDVFDLAAKLLLEFMGEAIEVYGAPLEILNLGGGFGAYYTSSDTPMMMRDSVRTIQRFVAAHCERLSLPLPHLILEPGRAVVAESAISLYTIGAIKEIPGVNTYAVTDGGLFENPRPQLYGSRYTAFLPDRMDETAAGDYTISGLCCETDTLIPQIALPELREGEVLAFLSSGAYQAAMAGNYQRSPKTAIVLVRDGRSQIIQRRQTIEDVLAFDVLPQ